MLFADDQLLIAQNYEELQYMTRKLIDEYELWGLKLNVKKTKYTPIRDIPRDLQLEDGKGTINYVNVYTYLGVKVTKDGNHFNIIFTFNSISRRDSTVGIVTRLLGWTNEESSFESRQGGEGGLIFSPR